MRKILILTRSHMRTTVYTHPSTDQVLEALKTCRIAHFACHGTSVYSDPSNSGLILQKSTGIDEHLVQEPAHSPTGSGPTA
jgi:CHAT domain-containing protein